MSRSKLMMVLLVGTIAACAPADDDADAMADAAAEQTPPPPINMTVSSTQFQPADTPESAGITGTAELRNVDGSTDVELVVRLQGVPEGPHGWHIHGAPCGAEGPVLIPLTATSTLEGISDALNAGSDGLAEKTVTIPAASMNGVNFETAGQSVRVHQKDGTDHGPTIACANLGRGS